MTKPVFGGFRPGNSNWPAQLQKQASRGIAGITPIDIILSRQWKTKALIRLCRCAG